MLDLHTHVVKVACRRRVDLVAFEARLCDGIAPTGVAVEVSSAGTFARRERLHVPVG